MTTSAPLPDTVAHLLAALAVRDVDPSLAMTAYDSARFLQPAERDRWALHIEAMFRANGVGPAAALYESLKGEGIDADAILHQIAALAPSLESLPQAPSPWEAFRRTSWDHAELVRQEFPPMTYAVDGIVPARGLAICAGKKKLGKSWLCLQLAQAVATGSPVLGRDTTQGQVLYLALEDGAARLQLRLRKQLAPPDLPIRYETRYPPLDEGGFEQLERDVDHLRPVLTIIDTLAAAKTGGPRENDASDMAPLINRLRDFSQDAGTGIFLTAHHGLHTSTDPGDDIRGSSAIAAASDLNLGLYREEGVHILRAEGRDIEEFELRLHFDKEQTWAWQVVGEGRSHQDLLRDEAEAAILDVLEEADGLLSVEQVVEASGKDRSTVQRHLKRLADEKHITREPRARGFGYGPLN